MAMALVLTFAARPRAPLPAPPPCPRPCPDVLAQVRACLGFNILATEAAEAMLRVHFTPEGATVNRGSSAFFSPQDHDFLRSQRARLLDRWLAPLIPPLEIATKVAILQGSACALPAPPPRQPANRPFRASPHAR